MNNLLGTVNVLGLIPARGGSVRCPRKNLADLGGKPLLQWTIDAARCSDYITTLAVSTDDPEILMCAGKNGCCAINRSIELATDNAPMLPVVKDALKSMSGFDAVILLQPTSPFRLTADIDRAYEMFVARGADAVISVTDGPEDYVFEVGHAGRIRRGENIVVPNGAIYILDVEALNQGHDWYSGITYAYKMPRDRSLDIDTPMDLAMARAVVEKSHAA